MRFKWYILLILCFYGWSLNAQSTNNVRKSGKSITKASTTKKKLTEMDVIGTWQLVKFKHGPQSKKRKPLTQCDTSMPWVFFKDSINSNKLLVKCEPMENCDDFGFESEWLFNGSSLIIKKTKIMGFGGVSSSGKFTIKELAEDRMVLDFMKNLYVFRKLN